MRCRRWLLSITLMALAGGALPAASGASATRHLVTGIVYGDNTFDLYVNGRRVAHDPIAFKPFNVVKVRFRATYPMTFAFKAVDYGDPVTALEYDNTKVGDGGLIAAFSNGVVTGPGWRAFTTSHGPTDVAACLADTSTCRVVSTPTPAHWQTTSAAARWAKATRYTEAQVQPHVDGFDAMAWGKAQFIWDDELVTDNTVLLRRTVRGPVPARS